MASATSALAPLLPRPTDGPARRDSIDRVASPCPRQWDAQGHQYLTVEAASLHLSTNPTALRARCRRHARRIGREVVARLGAGVVAYKFGTSWRLRIDPP